MNPHQTFLETDRGLNGIPNGFNQGLVNFRITDESNSFVPSEPISPSSLSPNFIMENYRNNKRKYPKTKDSLPKKPRPSSPLERTLTFQRPVVTRPTGMGTQQYQPLFSNPFQMNSPPFQNISYQNRYSKAPSFSSQSIDSNTSQSPRTTANLGDSSNYSRPPNFQMSPQTPRSSLSSSHQNRNPTTSNNKNKATSKRPSHPFADFIGYLVSPTRIQHTESWISFNMDTKLATIMKQLGESEKYKNLSEAEQPLQIQLSCHSLCPPNPHQRQNARYALISVNGKMIQPKLQYNCININKYLNEGKNVIRVTCSPGPSLQKENTFITQISLMRCYSIEELMEKIRKNPQPNYEELVQKVKKSFSTSGDVNEIQQISSMVSLRCPITRQLIKHPGRSVHCNHIQCFDLLNYLSISIRTQKIKWLCPICAKPISLGTLFFDVFFEKLLKSVEGRDIHELEILADGTWSLPSIEQEEQVIDLTTDINVHDLYFPNNLTEKETMIDNLKEETFSDTSFLNNDWEEATLDHLHFSETEIAEFSNLTDSNPLFDI